MVPPRKVVAAQAPSGTGQDAGRRRGSDLERWLALLWRTVHLGGVVALGAALMGAPVAREVAAGWVLGSGLVLLAQDVRAGRLVLVELAGLVVLLKLLAVAWAVLRPEHAAAVFWGLIAVSSLSSHAPKRVRHWRPRGDHGAGTARE